MHHGLARLDGKCAGVIQLPTRVFLLRLGRMEDDSTVATGHCTKLVLIPNYSNHPVAVSRLRVQE
jgi:hypothetical protein